MTPKSTDKCDIARRRRRKRTYKLDCRQWPSVGPRRGKRDEDTMHPPEGRSPARGANLCRDHPIGKEIPDLCEMTPDLGKGKPELCGIVAHSGKVSSDF